MNILHCLTFSVSVDFFPWDGLEMYKVLNIHVLLLSFLPWTRPRLGGLPHLETFTWQIVTPADRVTLPGRPGHPTYHVNVIKIKWEIIWTGGLPHLPGVPHLHLNRPLKALGNCIACRLLNHESNERNHWNIFRSDNNKPEIRLKLNLIVVRHKENKIAIFHCK